MRENDENQISGWVHLVKLLLFFSFILPAFSGCSRESGAVPFEEVPEAHSELPPDVVKLAPEAIETANIEVSQSKRIELSQYLETTGVVTPDEARVAHIRPIARGVIEKVCVVRGDRVRAGQPLVRYDNIELGELIGDYLAQKAQLQKALAEVEVARKFWERGVELLEFQAIAQKEVELREAQHKNARAMEAHRRSEIAKIEEKLHRFGLTEEEVDQLEDREHTGGHRTASHDTLRAPFSGVIIGYDVAEGELVSPERELLTLADVSTVWVLADVYEKDLGVIAEGVPCEIATASYPGRTFKGRLTYISAVLEQKTRTARMRCVVRNPESLLKIEMFTTVRIPTTLRREGVAVPEAAIQNLDGQDVVFIAEKNGQFRKKTVQTGLSADGWIEVEGLDTGVSVATKGSFYLKSAFKRSEIGEGH